MKYEIISSDEPAMKRYCHFCGKPYERRIKWKYTIFCSADCANSHRRDGNSIRSLKYHMKLVKRLKEIKQ